MRKRSIVLLAGAAAIAATLVVGPTATASSDRASAGTVVFIHDQGRRTSRVRRWGTTSMPLTGSEQHLVRRSDP